MSHGWEQDVRSDPQQSIWAGRRHFEIATRKLSLGTIHIGWVQRPERNSCKNEEYSTDARKVRLIGPFFR